MFFKKEREEARRKYNIEINFDLLKETICNNQINELRKYLKSYLNQKNCANYEFIFNKLIDIAFIRNDFAFLLEQLILIEKEHFAYLNSCYLNKCYESIANGDIEIAEIYLEIISHYGNLSVIRLLKSYIDNYEDKIIKDDVDNLYGKLIENGEIIKFIVPLKSKNLYVNKLKEYKDILTYQVINSNDCIIYLLYHPMLEYKDIITLRNNAKESYFEKRYKDAIYYNLNIVGRLTNPNDYLMSKIGICYYKLQNYEKAIDYLSIAGSISDEEQKRDRYQLLISEIKDLLPQPKILSKNIIE